jgi:hypothetical protein
MRYILHIEPIASEDEERVVAIFAPVLQAYLAGALPGRPATRKESRS